jgi:RNA polymerase sigma factor (sigma-70 family)
MRAGRTAQCERTSTRSGTAAVTKSSEIGVKGVSSDSDDDLLDRTPHNSDAFAAFYQRHERAVIGYFMRRTNDAELAADLTAETFAAALLAADRYRPGPQPASAWLFGIARHKLQRSLERQRVEDHARRKLGMQRLLLTDELLDAIERIGQTEPTLHLLEHLPRDQAAAIEGRVIHEFSYSQLAARLRCSESVARKRVSRGLKALRAIAKESM